MSNRDKFLRGLNSHDDPVVREAQYLRRILERSKTLYRPVENIELGFDSNLRTTLDLKIGLISRCTPYCYSHIENPEVELAAYEMPDRYTPRGESYYSIVVPNCVSEIEKARTFLLEKIEHLCAEKNANVICANELAYPAFASIAVIDTLSKEDKKRLRAGERVFRKSLQGFADRYDTVIVAGTYHDPRSIKNLAMVFIPHHPDVIKHEKLTTAKARSVGEIVRPPRTNEFPLYALKCGYTAVLVCLDAYDLNMLIRQWWAGERDSEDKSPDVILVPAYSPKSLKEACQDLSYFSRSTVIYSNGGLKLEDGTVGAEQAVYLCGQEYDLEVLSDLHGYAQISGQERGAYRQQAYESQQIGLRTLMKGFK